ncbi:2-keto-4-pentenoate hydratase [Pseudoalteromonas sp. S3178]|uniref:2-keto-4-pentenoate hydratase n=1 Tax=Pseudoalteromonas sp. S3178 TaxID=579532 RepID=UPI00110B8886|nr:2-keto-4-pentenoate hydratase [Pseudoalteromonas sp. S3178]TMP03655.1 2-keto-4-pentenoate hydratase [Pseudoalteromonas sp. S3178]
MSDLKQLTDIAAHLLSKRECGNGASDLPEEFTIESIEDVLAIQKLMIKLNDETVYGWKCMLPSSTGAITLAPLLYKPINATKTCLLNTKNNKALIEPEIAFVLNKDLTVLKEYTNEQIDSAVSRAHLALELIENRFSKQYEATQFEKLADGLSNQGVYIGPEISLEKAYESNNITLIVEQEGDKSFNVIGQHPGHLPQLPLYWAINFLSANGFKLEKNQVFITGSFNGLMEMDINKEIQITYEELGKLHIKFEIKNSNKP